MALIEVDALSKSFGSLRAVSDVSFNVEPGEVVAFLGPNGAGKSTTMKMIAGFLAPDSGTARLDGLDVRERSLEARRVLGYLPEGAPAYGEMTPLSFLRFCASTRGLRGAQRERAVERAIERTNLLGVLGQPIETLSKGFKRRVGLAQAIMHEPRALVLDEPTDGLDPNQKAEVRGLIRSLATSTGVLLSTHILEEVEAVCTRAILIRAGTVIVDESPAKLLARSAYRSAVSLGVRAPAGSDVLAQLRAIPGVASVREAGQSAGGSARFTLFPESLGSLDPGASLAQGPAGMLLAQRAMQAMSHKGWLVDGLAIEGGRLDDVFHSLTRDDRAGGGQ